MRAISFALACLACAAQGRRVHTMTDRAQRTLNDESKPAQSLAKTLLGFNIPAAVSRKTAPQRASSPAMELYQEGKAIPEPDPEVASKMSRAMPFLKAPAYLDGSMPGDQGFDPMGMSTTVFSYGSNINYYREAELMHGRQAMLAVVGFIWPSVFGKLNVDWAQDVSYNPLYAVFQLPAEVYAQLAVFMIAAESLRANVIFNEDREPGDHGFDPLDFQGKFCKTPEELFVMKEKELANGRLAMIAFVGLVIQLTEKGEAPPFI